MARVRNIVAILALFAVSACALPPALVATSSAGDSATYKRTRKSMADYALSSIVERDCTVMYGFTRGQFCQDMPEEVEEPKAAKAASDDVPEPEAPIFATAEEMAAWAENERTASAAAPKTASKRAAVSADPKWAVVLGVFTSYEQASVLARQLKPGPAVITSIIVQGEVYFRVTSRPFELDDAPKHEKQAAAAGLPDAKILPVCPRWMENENCLVVDSRPFR